MTGLLLLAVVGLWIWACVAITKAAMRRVSSERWRWIVGLALFSVLLILPVLDEIVGGFQFRALCKRNAVVHLGQQNPQGKITRVTINPLNEIVPSTAVRIYRSHVEYHDVATGELVAMFDEYTAKGGLLIRLLGISESNSPLTIGRPSCSGEREVALPKALNFKVIN